MSSLDDSGAIFRYHRSMLAEHGKSSSLSLGWRERHDQLIRFDALAGIADLTDKTILDAGCGYGDLYDFLAGRYSISHYYGIEQIPEMLQEAVQRHWQTTNTTFISRNFLMSELPIADYVFASGSLNYDSSDPGYIFKAITTLFQYCRCGLAFNLLRNVPENGLLVAYETGMILEYCRSLSNKVIIRTDYAPEDFTIYLYRDTDLS